MLIDDATAMVGSLALTALSLDFRREVALTVTDPAAVAEVVELFRLVRDGQTGDGARPAAACDVNPRSN